MVSADEKLLLDSVPDGLFIGGQWRPAASGQTLDVNDPATGEVLKSIADASADEAVQALDAAVGAPAGENGTQSSTVRSARAARAGGSRCSAFSGIEP